jgi:hypothetical protein
MRFSTVFHIHFLPRVLTHFVKMLAMTMFFEKPGSKPSWSKYKLTVNMARSDESEPEDRDTVERDALLLAQTYTSQETKVGTGTGCAILVSVEACSLPGDAGLALQPDV